MLETIAGMFPCELYTDGNDVVDGIFLYEGRERLNQRI